MLRPISWQITIKTKLMVAMSCPKSSVFFYPKIFDGIEDKKDVRKFIQTQICEARTIDILNLPYFFISKKIFVANIT